MACVEVCVSPYLKTAFHMILQTTLAPTAMVLMTLSTAVASASLSAVVRSMVLPVPGPRRTWMVHLVFHAGDLDGASGLPCRGPGWYTWSSQLSEPGAPASTWSGPVIRPWLSSRSFPPCFRVWMLWLRRALRPLVADQCCHLQGTEVVLTQRESSCWLQHLQHDADVEGRSENHWDPTVLFIPVWNLTL